MRELRASSKLYHKRIAEEKRVERERAKLVREKERAEKAAEKQRQKEERDRQKAIQTSQTGKRKASRALALKNKRQKRSGDGVAARVAHTRSLSLLPQITSRGRTIKVLSKFR
jgi:23S rRNA pseudoU1915 N3-methylase RlmH